MAALARKEDERKNALEVKKRRSGVSLRVLENLQRRAELLGAKPGPAAEAWSLRQRRAANEPLSVRDVCNEICKPETARDKTSFSEMVASGGLAELGPAEVRTKNTCFPNRPRSCPATILEPITPPRLTTNPPHCVTYTRYAFTCLCVCKNQSSLSYSRPFALPTLLQYYCAIFAPYISSPRPSLYMPYTIQYW